LTWLIAALRSSVGKKFVMGITGLFLCSFLVIHLAGNMLLWTGPDAYNDYAHKLHSSPAFLIPAEILLVLGFIVHIYLAVVTNAENRRARGEVTYSLKQSKRGDRWLNMFGWSPDTTMFVTGAIIFAYLILHVTDFKFGEFFHADAVAGKTPYGVAQALLADPVRAAAYLAASLFVGVHVSHGLSSAFQSLGFNHPRYNCWIRCLSITFAVVVAAGFASFAAWGLSQTGNDTADEPAPPVPSVSPHP